MAIALADLLAPVTVADLVVAGVHPIKARPLAAFHGRAIAITRASFKADWCACNDHDTPIPCRCEPVKKASAT